MSFNKIIIVGNLGRDPELKYTSQGQAVCEFSVATSEKRKDSSGELKEETTWFRVSCWGKLAEVASRYLAKGRQVYIEGRLRAREWTDKEGKTRTSLEVFTSELKLLGSRSDQPNNDSDSVKASDSVKPSEPVKAPASTSTVNPSAKPAKPTNTATKPANTANYSDELDDSVSEDDIPF